MKELHIMNRITTTIRELEPGEAYITITNIRAGRVTPERVRVRTNDPFTSLTLMGTKVSSYPSDKCHPVEIREEGYATRK